MIVELGGLSFPKRRALVRFPIFCAHDSKRQRHDYERGPFQLGYRRHAIRGW